MYLDLPSSTAKMFEEAEDMMNAVVQEAETLVGMFEAVQAVNNRFLTRLERAYGFKPIPSWWRLVHVSGAILSEGSYVMPDQDWELRFCPTYGGEVCCGGRHSFVGARCGRFLLHPLLLADTWPCQLDALMALLVEEKIVLQPGFPVYGGAPPSYLEQVWSWDEHEVLVGPMRQNLELVDRASWEAMHLI